MCDGVTGFLAVFSGIANENWATAVDSANPKGIEERAMFEGSQSANIVPLKTAKNL
jgi:hypothetical protein